MKGLMMDTPLQISSLIRHADRYHGDTEIVSRMVEGGIHRYTYAQAHRRSRQLANALLALGVRAPDRIERSEAGEGTSRTIASADTKTSLA